MARIRTLKPEFFRSPDTAKVDFPVRIFYQALWCWADDFGIGETNLNGLLGFAFPDEDGFTAQDLRRFCADVARVFGVTFYTVRGRHYYAVKTWDSHQKLERREARRKNPLPDDPDATPDQRIYGCADSAPTMPRKSGAESGECGAGTGEQGNRGTGEAAASEQEDNLLAAINKPSTPPLSVEAVKLVRKTIPDEHPPATRSSLTHHVGAMLVSGTPHADITATLELWLAKPHLGPGALPSVLSEVIRSRDRPSAAVNSNGHAVSTTDLRVAQAQALKSHPGTNPLELP